MEINVILPYAIVALVAILLPLSSCDIIDDTCKQTPNPQFCTSVLRSDPRSKGADVSGLALIMIDKLKTGSISNVAEIDKLLSSKPDLKAPLTGCRKIYNFILKYDVTVAYEAVSKGDPKFGEDSMKDAAQLTQNCDDSFRKFSSNPLSARNKEAFFSAGTAAAIIRLLL